MNDTTKTLRIAGSPDDKGLIARWVEGFSRTHPDVKFLTHLTGPDSTMAWLYTGQADLALLDRELKTPVEHMAFTWVYQYPETKIVVAHAGLDPNRLGAVLTVFVNVDNPITSLSLDQLAELYGADRKTPDTWGSLGAKGAWAARPVHVYGPDLDSTWALAWRHAVLHGSYKWNAAYREIDGSASRAIAAVATDPDGIAFGPPSTADAKVRAIAIAKSSDKPAVAPTPSTIANGSYPLSRPISFVLNRKPGEAFDPNVKAFLDYVLSPAGQSDVTADGAYVALDQAELRKQQEKLQ